LAAMKPGVYYFFSPKINYCYSTKIAQAWQQPNLEFAVFWLLRIILFSFNSDGEGLAAVKPGVYYFFTAEKINFSI
jgi:hypothetical protein